MKSTYICFSCVCLMSGGQPTNCFLKLTGEGGGGEYPTDLWNSMDLRWVDEWPMPTSVQRRV